MSGRHAPHLRLAVPPRLSAHPSFRFPSTPLPTPSKTRGLPSSASAGSPSSPYAAALLRLLVLHALFLLAPAVRALPSPAHVLALPPLLALLAAAALLLLHFAAVSRKAHQPHHPFPGLPALLRPALLLALSLLLRLLSLRVIPSPGILVLAESAGALLARALHRPSRRRVLSVAVAALSLVCISPSPSVILAIPFASGFLSSAEHSATARHATRSRRGRAAAFALAAAVLSVPALVGLTFFGGSEASDGLDGAVSIGPLWWVLLNAAFFGMALGRRQEQDGGSGRPSVDFAMTFLCALILELVYYPKLSLPAFLICGFLLWIASRELAPAGYVELGSEDVSESVYEAVMGPVRHILSERKSRKIAAFLLINTAYMFVEFGSGFMSDSLGLISDACHMLFDCAALVIGLYASYIARLPANGMYNFGRGRFEILSGYVNAVFLVLVGALIVLESFERILEPREISTGSLLAVSIGGLVVNMIGLVFFHEEHHHAHGGTCSHSHSHPHSHSHSHSHQHGHEHHQHHGHEDHRHHDHDHHSVNHVKACCDHNGDESHHHGHHGNSNREGIHNNLMDNACKEKYSHSHGHEHHHHDNSEHCHQSGDHAHQNCSSITTGQQLLEIPLSNTHSHGTEGHSSKAVLCSSESGNHKKSGHRHHIDHNMEGIFLHVLADTMGSVGVVISTLLIKYKGWLIADPICSVFISVMIISSVLPLLRNSAEILLQRVPRSHEKDLTVALDDVMKIEDVLGVDNVHVWNLTNTDIVGTFHLHVSAEADKSSIRDRASQIFHEAGVQDLTIQIECVER
ncbi:Metal tolerance protein 8 [Dichanthelium oligosanthes]|uniref:Metal tolerance protein 8 n=1 Tax=Dichanthelium oligosanthes TaxID=888268 RepID=A0A1E5VPG2_9POAL|nr:Metal tolerance protein 8 [Dichanthelium oligosanthes]